MKYFLLFLISLIPLSAWAVDTTVTYSSSFLILLFIGLCAILIIMQLIPAILMLIGISKASGKKKFSKLKY